MSMSKKHFELIAEAIRVERPERITLASYPSRSVSHRACNRALDNVAENLAEEFAMLNPRFDEERFIEATGGRDA